MKLKRFENFKFKVPKIFCKESIDVLKFVKSVDVTIFYELVDCSSSMIFGTLFPFFSPGRHRHFLDISSGYFVSILMVSLMF